MVLACKAYICVALNSAQATLTFFPIFWTGKKKGWNGKSQGGDPTGTTLTFGVEDLKL